MSPDHSAETRSAEARLAEARLAENRSAKAALANRLRISRDRVLGEVPGSIWLVENEADVDAVVLTEAQQSKLAVTTQTTLSQWDTRRLLEYIKVRYPHVEVHVDICAATQKRQEAVAEQASGADLTIVVGDPRSNNTNRLVQVSEEIVGVPAVRIEDISQLKQEWLVGKKRIAVTAGASTPSHLTREVIHYLEQYQQPGEPTTGQQEIWEMARTSVKPPCSKR